MVKRESEIEGRCESLPIIRLWGLESGMVRGGRGDVFL